MPVYLNCPHCEHPQIVPQHRRGRVVVCRQCAQAYVTSREEQHPELIGAAGAGSNRQTRKEGVYVLD